MIDLEYSSMTEEERYHALPDSILKMDRCVLWLSDAQGCRHWLTDEWRHWLRLLKNLLTVLLVALVRFYSIWSCTTIPVPTKTMLKRQFQMFPHPKLYGWYVWNVTTPQTSSHFSVYKAPKERLEWSHWTDCSAGCLLNSCIYKQVLVCVPGFICKDLFRY